MNRHDDTAREVGRAHVPRDRPRGGARVAELRADLGTLVDTSPNGVVVFDAPTGRVRSPRALRL